MSMNFMVYSLAMRGYYVIGFALQAGGIGAAHSVTALPDFGSSFARNLSLEVGVPLGDGKFLGLLGWSGFCLPQRLMESAADPKHLDGGIFAFFLFSMVFMATAAIIPTGAMLERWRFKAFCWYGLGVGAFIYPVYANWVWGGGWLAAMGTNWGLGHGHVDFAGSSVVHLCGGTIAFVGARMLGQRRGRDEPGQSFRAHNIPMGVLGTFILALGWFGFNAGSTLSGIAENTSIGVVAVNTMLASAAGAIVGMLISWKMFDYPDPTFMCNGMLAGFVAITASCAFVDSWAAVLTGGAAALAMFFAALYIEERLKIDDPVGAISVHGVGGLVGLLSLGLFANGRFGEGWNNKPEKVKGLLYGDLGQFFAEIIGGVVCVAFVYITATLLFKLIGRFCPHRPTLREEEEGLDKSEFNRTAYVP
jgi:Amt family ammonium transporter